MKLLALCLTLLLFLGGCPLKEESEWEAACRMLADVYSCDGVAPPKIEYFGEPGEEASMYGYYEGGDTIYIHVDREGWEKKETIFHETVHYLQHMVGDLELPGPVALVCAAEEEAFRFTDIYIELVLERPDDKVGDEWWVPYWYCWKYYAPAGSIGIFIGADGDEIIRVY